MKNKKLLVFIIIAALVIVAAFWFIQSKKKKTTIQAKEITVTIGDIRAAISTTGTIQPQNRVEIKPPIDGRIDKILVTEGDRVKKGDTLAWMSSTERATLLDSARSEGEEAVKYWETAYKPIPLIAPINGEIIVKAIEPGQTVTPAIAVLVISDRLIVQAQVDETDIGKVKVGQNAVIALDAYPEQKVRAKVDHIAYESTVVNNVTIYQVDILPARILSVFRSGMSANVDIIAQEKKDVLLLPVDAVKEDREGSYVFELDPQTKKDVKHRIQTGMSDDQNLEIVSGLNENDKVIIRSKAYSLPQTDSQSGTNPFMPSRPRTGRR